MNSAVLCFQDSKPVFRFQARLSKSSQLYAQRAHRAMMRYYYSAIWECDRIKFHARLGEQART